MAGPLCILYELGIISARLFGRRARKPVVVPETETASVAAPPADSGGASLSAIEFGSLDLPSPWCAASGTRAL